MWLEMTVGWETLTNSLVGGLQVQMNAGWRDKRGSGREGRAHQWCPGRMGHGHCRLCFTGDNGQLSMIALALSAVIQRGRFRVLACCSRTCAPGTTSPRQRGLISMVPCEWRPNAAYVPRSQ